MLPLDFSEPICAIDPVSKNGLFSFSIDADLVSKLASPFSSVLHGRFRGFRKAIDVVHKSIEELLPLREKFHVAAVDEHEVLIRFASKVNFLNVYTRNCIQVEGIPMRLHQWRPSLQNVVDPKIVVTWVVFLKLSLHLQHLVLLRSFVSPWGTFLDVDRDTLFMTCPAWMHVCVEINCMNLVPNSIIIEDGSSSILQNIMLEYLSCYCIRCGSWGHFNSVCKGTARAWPKNASGVQQAVKNPVRPKFVTPMVGSYLLKTTLYACFGSSLSLYALPLVHPLRIRDGDAPT